jgi:hypothetical protein
MTVSFLRVSTGTRPWDSTMDWYEQAITDGVKQGWIDRPGSRNRLNGLEEVHKRMPKEMQAALPPLVIFSPRLDAGGLTLRREMPLNSAFVYLSPTLEKEHCVDATWAVAHEFAHVALGHGQYRLRTQEQVDADERAASDLALKWGVPKRNPRTRPLPDATPQGRGSTKTRIGKIAEFRRLTYG